MKISIFGSYGEHNLGDEAILDAFLDTLTKKFQAKCIVFSHRPTKSAKIHKHPHVHFRTMIPTGIRSFLNQLKNGYVWQSIQLLKTSDLIIIGGGGLFYEKEVKQKGMPPVVVWWLRCVLFCLLQKKYVLCGVGVSVLRSFVSRLCMRMIVRWSSGVLVRDEFSHKQLVQLNKKFEKKITVACDVVWSKGRGMGDRERDGDGDGERKDSAFPIKIAFQLREVIGVDGDTLAMDMAAVIDQLQEFLDVEVGFFPLSTNNPDDSVLIKKVMSLCKRQPKNALFTHSHPDQVRNAFRAYDIVCTTRFHGAILAIQAGSIPYIMSYTHKTKSLIESIQNTTTTTIQHGDIRHLNTEKCIHDISTVLSSLPILRKEYHIYHRTQSSFAKKQYKDFFFGILGRNRTCICSLGGKCSIH